jgi:Tfp pilus assembly protein PilP
MKGSSMKHHIYAASVLAVMLAVSGCGKSSDSDDLAAIRAIKEKEQADIAAKDKEAKAMFEKMQKAASEPIRPIKY